MSTWKVKEVFVRQFFHEIQVRKKDLKKKEEGEEEEEAEKS